MTAVHSISRKSVDATRISIPERSAWNGERGAFSAARTVLRGTLRAFAAQVVACAPPPPRPSAVPTCLAKECLSATLDRTKLVSRPVPVRGQVRYRSALVELLRRQGEALGPNSWNGTSC